MLDQLEKGSPSEFLAGLQEYRSSWFGRRDPYAIIDPIQHELFGLSMSFGSAPEPEVRSVQRVDAEGVGVMFSMRRWGIFSDSSLEVIGAGFKLERQSGVSVFVGEERARAADQIIYSRALESISSGSRGDKEDAAACCALAEVSLRQYVLASERFYGPCRRVVEDPGKLKVSLVLMQCCSEEDASYAEVVRGDFFWRLDLMHHRAEVGCGAQGNVRPVNQADLRVLSEAAADLFGWAERLI